MFEKQVSAALFSYLKQFIANLNEEQLKLSIWSGNLILKDLVLQPTALDELSELLKGNSTPLDANKASTENPSLLPFAMRKGDLKELRITVPWTTLDREPLCIEVSGLHIFLTTLRAQPYTAAEEEARSKSIRKMQLERFERSAGVASPLMEGASSSTIDEVSEHSFSSPTPNSSYPSTNLSQKSFLEQLLEKIVRNAFLVFRDIKISYEMDYPGLFPGFAAGFSLTVEEALIVNTDEHFHDRFVFDLSLPICKRAEVVGLSVEVFSGKNDPEREEQQDPVPHAQGKDDTEAASVVYSPHTFSKERCPWHYHSTLLKIPEFQVQFLHRQTCSSSDEGGNFHCHFFLSSEIIVNISFAALLVLRNVYVSLVNSEKSVSYRNFLPILTESCSSRVSLGVRRWKFAIRCVVSQICARRSRSSNRKTFEPQEMMVFCQTRRQYCELYKRSLKVPWLCSLSSSEAAEFFDMEQNLSLETILFLRSFGRAELLNEKEQINLQKTYVRNAEERARTKNGGKTSRLPSFFSSWGWSKSVEEERESDFSSSSQAKGLTSSVSESEGSMKQVDPVNSNSKFLRAFELFWERSKNILNTEFKASALEGSGLITAIEGKPSAGSLVHTPWTLQVSLESIVIHLVPNYHGLDLFPQEEASVRAFSPSFLERIHQQFSTTLKKVNVTMNFSEVGVGRCNASVGSVESKFSGLRTTPLLSSDTSSTATDFFTIAFTSEETFLEVHSATMVLYPNHELLWWGKELAKGMELWNDCLSKDCVVGPHPSSSPSSKHWLFSSHEWRARIHSLSIIFPLSHDELTSKQQQLSTDGEELNSTRRSLSLTSSVNDVVLSEEVKSKDAVSMSDISPGMNFIGSLGQKAKVVIAVPKLTCAFTVGGEEGRKACGDDGKSNEALLQIFTEDDIVVSCYVARADEHSLPVCVDILLIGPILVQQRPHDLKANLVYLSSLNVTFECSALALLNDFLIKPSFSVMLLECEMEVTPVLLHSHLWKLKSHDELQVFGNPSSLYKWESETLYDSTSALCSVYFSYDTNLGVNGVNSSSSISHSGLERLGCTTGGTANELDSTTIFFIVNTVRAEFRDVVGSCLATVEMVEKEAGDAPSLDEKGCASLLARPHAANACYNWTTGVFSSVHLFHFDLSSGTGKTIASVRGLAFSSALDRALCDISIDRFSISLDSEVIPPLSFIVSSAASLLPLAPSIYADAPSLSQAYTLRIATLSIDVPLLATVESIPNSFLYCCFSNILCQVVAKDNIIETEIELIVERVEKREELGIIVMEYQILSASDNFVGDICSPTLTAKLRKTSVSVPENVWTVSVKLAGGQFSIYFPLLFELPMLSEDAFYTDLMHICKENFLLHGFTGRGEEWKQRVRERMNTSQGLPVHDVWTIEATIRDLELFIATDCSVPIDLSQSETYFFMFLSQAEVYARSTVSLPATMTTVCSAHIRGLFYFPSHSPSVLSTLVNEIKSTFYCSVNNGKMSCEVKTKIPDTGEVPEMWLSVGQVCALAEVFNFNWSALPPDSPVPIVYERYLVESLMPKFVVIVQVSSRTAISLKFENGIQFFLEDITSKLCVENLQLACCSFPGTSELTPFDLTAALQESQNFLGVIRTASILWECPLSMPGKGGINPSDPVCVRCTVSGVDLTYSSISFSILLGVVQRLGKSQVPSERCERKLGQSVESVLALSFSTTGKQTPAVAESFTTLFQFSLQQCQLTFFEPCDKEVHLLRVILPSMNLDSVYENAIVERADFTMFGSELLMNLKEKEPGYEASKSRTEAHLLFLEHFHCHVNYLHKVDAELTQKTESIVIPFRIAAEAQLLSCNFTDDHLQRLVGYARNELYIGKESIMKGDSQLPVRAMTSSEEVIETANSIAFLPEEMNFICHDLNIFLSPLSVHVKQIVLSQSTLTWKDDSVEDDVSEAAGSESGHFTSSKNFCGGNEVLFIAPKLEVKDSKITVGPEKEALCLPDIHLCVSCPLPISNVVMKKNAMQTTLGGDYCVKESLDGEAPETTLHEREESAIHGPTAPLTYHAYEGLLMIRPGKLVVTESFLQSLVVGLLKSNVANVSQLSLQDVGAIDPISKGSMESTVPGTSFNGTLHIDCPSLNLILEKRVVRSGREDVSNAAAVMNPLFIVHFSHHSLITLCAAEFTYKCTLKMQGKCEAFDGKMRQLAALKKENPSIVSRNMKGTGISSLTVLADVEKSEDGCLLAFQLNGVELYCNYPVVDLLVDLKRFYFRFNEVLSSGVPPSTPKKSAESSLGSWLSQKITIEGKVYNTSCNIEDIAILHVEDVEFKVDVFSYILPHSHDSVNKDICMVRFGNVTLTDLPKAKKYIEICSGDIKIEVGSITVCVQGAIASHFEGYTLIAYRLTELQSYILLSLDLPKKIDQGFERKVVLTFLGLEARFADYSAHPSCEKGYLRVRFPALALREFSTSLKVQYLVDTENASVDYLFCGSYHEGSKVTSISILEKWAASAQYEADLMKQVRSLGIRFGKLIVCMPTSQQLSDCTGSVFQTLLAYTAETTRNQERIFYAEHKEFLSPNSRRATDIPNQSAVSSPEQWTESKITCYISEIQWSVFSSSYHSHSTSPLSCVLQSALVVKSFSVEHSVTPSRLTFLVEVQTVTSSVHSSLFEGPFLAASARSETVDPKFRKGVHIRVEHEVSECCCRSEGVPSPLEKINVTWRLNQFCLALSPEWLRMIRDEVLYPISSTAYKVHQEMQQRNFDRGPLEADTFHRHFFALPSRENVLVEGNTIVVSADHCLSSNLMIGGPYGMVLRFQKNRYAKVVGNLINITSVPGAKIIVSSGVNTCGKPTQWPIIVEEGLTVNLINTPIYLGSHSLENIVLLEERSFFNVASEYIMSSDKGGEILSLQGEDAPTSDCLGEWVCRSIDVDASVDLALTMWSKLDKVSLFTTVMANYHSETVFLDGALSMVEYIDENGKVQVRNLVIRSNSSVITDKAVTIIMEVRHRQLEGSEGGVTSINMDLPATHLSFTLEQLKLLYRTEFEIFKCVESLLKDFREVSGPPSPNTAAYQHLSQPLKSATNRTAASILRMNSRKPFHSLLDLRLSSPCLEITLNHDLGGKIVFFSFLNTTCEVDGNRDLCSLTCQLRSEIEVSDFPYSTESRVLLSCSPQLSFSHNWYAEGSLSIEASIACSNAILTVPLLTLTELYHFYACPKVSHEPFVMHNFLGRNVTILWPSGECAVLESGSNTLVEQCYRTSSCHVLLGDATEFVKEHPGDVKRACACVDFAKIREVGSCRFSQLRPESLGVLDTVFRLSLRERQLHITSSVIIKNHLQHFTVELSEDWMQLPGEEVYASLDMLLQPFQLRVNGYEQKLASPLQVTWETLISAFVVLPEDIFRGTAQRQAPGAVACTIADNAVRLTFPLTNTKGATKSKEELLISVLLKREPSRESIHFSPSMFQKCDVSISVEAFYSLINITGGDVGVSLGNDREFLLVAHNEAIDLFPLVNGIEDFSTLKLHFRLHSIDESGMDYTGALCLSNLPVHFERFIPLANAVNQTEMAIIIKHHTTGKLILQTVGIVQNNAPNCLAIQFTRGTLSSGVVRLPPGAQNPIYLPFKGVANEVSGNVDEPVYMKIAAYTGASQEVYEWSEAYFCSAPIPPATLTSLGTEKSIHVLIRTQAIPSAMDSQIPLIEILCKWCLKNSLQVPLEIKIASTNLDIILIPPGEVRCLVEFPSLSISNPLIQLRLLLQDASSSWSSPFYLGTLCTFGSVQHWKYQLPGDFVSADELPLLEALRVPAHPTTPMEREKFVNLLLAPSVEHSQCVLEVSADSVLPVVIENRVGFPLQVRQLPPSSGALLSSSKFPWAYFVPAHSDTVFSFDTLSKEPKIRVDLLDGTARFHVILAGFGNLAVFEDVQKLGSFFVAVTLKTPTSVSSYIITITEAPIIERRLLSSTRCVRHLDLLLEKLLIYVSSAWCYSDMKESSMKHFQSMVNEGPWRLCCGDANKMSEMTEKEVGFALQARELDLFLVEISGLYLSVLENEKHVQGNISVGRVEVLDCTSSHPFHPIVLTITDPKGSRPDSPGKRPPTSAGDQGTRHLPCLNFSYHLVFPRSIPSYSAHSSLPSSPCVKIILKRLSIHVEEVCLRLHDNFLYTVIAAGKRAFESPVPREKKSPEQSGSFFYSKGEAITPPPPRTYDYSLQNVSVSSIHFRITLTRRVDGILNPFEDISNLLGFIVPSIDGAPISFPSWKLSGYNVRSTQAIVFLTDVVWPAYRTPAILQFYKVLGSMEMIGNPVALISGWSRAVRLLISGAASLDLVSGAQDFFREATSSTLHSVHLLSHIGSRVASKLAFDDRWTTQQDTDEGEGSLSSLSLTKGLTNGIMDGVGGIFQKPMNGVRDRGMPGLFSGVAGGMAGLLSRPLSGALRSVGNTAHFFSLLLEEDTASPSSVVDTYLGKKRNFIPFSRPQESDPPKSIVYRRFIEGEFITMKEFQFLGLADGLKNCATSVFDSVVARIGIHNVMLHGPPHVLAQTLSEKDLYSGVELMIAGSCARMWVKIIEGFPESHEEIEKWKEKKMTNFITEEIVGEGELESPWNSVTLEEVKNRTSLREFRENFPALLNRASQGFLCLLCSLN